MSLSLVRGANTTILPAGAAGTVTVHVFWPSTTAVELDACAFLVTAGGKVRGDADFVFYNSPVSPEGAVRLLADEARNGDAAERLISIDLGLVPADVARIIVGVSVYDAIRRRQNFGQVGALGARVVESAGQELCRFDFTAETGAETAMVFGEVYRRNTEWKFRAVGQGHEGGLAALAMRFGVEVEPDPEPLPAASADAAPYPLTPPEPELHPSTAATSTTLVQHGQRAGLAIGPGVRGELLIVLPRGGKPGQLGSLYELSDGARGYVGPIGSSWGEYHQRPHIRYFAAAFGGDPASGEAFAIDASQLNRIARLLVFATVEPGAPERRLSVSLPNGRPVEAPVTGSGVLALALLERLPDSLAVTYLGERFAEYQDLDDHYRWGLQWSLRPSK